MSTFLNLNLDKKINTNFLAKHLIFSTFWIVGIALFIFRIDLLFIDNYGNSFQWLKTVLPTIFVASLIVGLFFLRWYYKLALLVYPLLLIFWFIPKTVLINGKIYLFGNYINSLFSKFAHLKRTLFYLFWIAISVILFATISSEWASWFAILTFSYFYVRYVFKLLEKSFQEPTLFGQNLEEKIRETISKPTPNESLLITSFIKQKADEELELTERREKQIKRSVIANHAIELLTSRLNGFKGRKAFLISWVYSSLKFLFFSIIFFWFLNFQLFKIDGSNFVYSGTMPAFDFLYYTLKTITFGDIEAVKPMSVLSRASEISSFFIIGIFFLVIFVSVLFSLKQDRMNENVKLTTDLFQSENLTLARYLKEEFGMELKTAIVEVRNIDESLGNLRNIIDKLL